MGIDNSANPFDVVIVGGGIAGLWSLTRLIQLGYHALLIEKDELGCGQSLAAQGIVHGGMKYSLQGKLTQSTLSIEKMPQYWRNCIQGNGEVDLQGVKLRSNFQYLWTENNFSQQLSAFFASKLIRSRLQKLAANEFPDFFKHKRFKGRVYQLDEPVLDMHSLISYLVDLNPQQIIKTTIRRIIKKKHQLFEITTNNKSIYTKSVILCAGNATADLFELFKNENGNAFNFPQMQQRGLQMVMLESKSLPALSAHRLGLGASPLLTISHHQTAINTPVWYLGGEISEKYIHLAPKELIAIAKKQLKKLIPWRDFDDARWSTLKINRAEPKTKDGSRPNEPFVDNCEGVLTCWPIKMAMSPILFAQIQQQLQSLQILPQKGQLDVEQSQWQSFERPAIASMPWDRDNEWYE